MRFSPFNPIRFYKAGTLAISVKDYMQTFHTSDIIRLEIFHSSDYASAPMEILQFGSNIVSICDVWREYMINYDCSCSIYRLTGLDVGVYALRIGDYQSDPVRIISDNSVDGTILIQYAYRDNKDRTDIVSSFYGNILFYELRIPGGFKDAGWKFKVFNEQYFSQFADIVELTAIDYTEKELTIGTSTGIPAQVATLINLILSCPLIFIDCIRYSRSEGAILEHKDGDTLDMHVYSVTLREAHYINAEFERNIRINLRKVPDSVRRANLNLRRL